MKNFKLLKDLPWIKAWEIITYWEIPNSYLKNYLYDYLDNTEWFEEIKEPKTIYNLEDWDYFYYINYINYNWNVIKDIWRWYEVDVNCLNIWNVFLTQEEAEKKLAKMKARAKIKRWIYENDDNYKFIHMWNNYYINNQNDILKSNYCNVWMFPITYFSSEEKCKQAIVELEAEYKILFDIK